MMIARAADMDEKAYEACTHTHTPTKHSHVRYLVLTTQKLSQKKMVKTCSRYTLSPEIWYRTQSRHESTYTEPINQSVSQSVSQTVSQSIMVMPVAW